MARITRFEMHASQPQSLIDFYGAVFGWTFQKVDPPGFWRITTGPTSEGGISGGLVQRPCPPPGNTPAVNAFICTIDVASVDETLAKAIGHGAVVAMPKFTVPGMGFLAYVKDPDGNVLGILQNVD